MILLIPSFDLSLWLVAGLALLILPILALIHLLRSNMHGQDRLTWVLLVLLIPVAGAILYFLVGRKHYIS